MKARARSFPDARRQQSKSEKVLARGCPAQDKPISLSALMERTVDDKPILTVVELGLAKELLEALLAQDGTFERVASVQAAFASQSDVILMDNSAIESALELRRDGDTDPDLPLIVGVCGGAEGVERALANGADEAVVVGGDASVNLGVLLRAVAWLKELETRRQHQQLLGELQTSFDVSGEFEETIYESLTAIVEGTPAARAVCVVANGSERALFLMGTSDDATAIGVTASDDAFAEVGRVLDSKLSVFVEAVPVDSRLSAYRSSHEIEMCSLHLEPLLCDGEAFGALELHLPLGVALCPVDRELVCRIAAMLGPRIYQSDRYQSLKEQTKRRTIVSIEGEATLAVLRKYKEFFERASDGIAVLDEDGKVFYLNPAGEEITGYAAHGIAGLPFEEMVAKRDRPLLRVLLERPDELWGEVADLHLITTSGDPIIVSVAVSDSAVSEKLIVLSFRDVTEPRALAEELRHTKEFLERLIDSTVDAIVAGDIDGTIILFNKGAERLYGLCEREVLGVRRFSDLFRSGVAETIFERLRSPLDGGVGRLELIRKEIVNADSELVPVRLSASIIYENGVEVGMVATISDLRERLHIERRLVRAQERLVETEKQALIAELAGTTAHELNQPLTSVMGYAELLKRRLSEDDTNHRAADRIMQECQRLADIVRKIGKITRYETKTYVGGTQILDLDKASEESDAS
jgi:PAS domain S-box-containing protein